MNGRRKKQTESPRVSIAHRATENNNSNNSTIHIQISKENRVLSALQFLASLLTYSSNGSAGHLLLLQLFEFYYFDEIYTFSHHYSIWLIYFECVGELIKYAAVKDFSLSLYTQKCDVKKVDFDFNQSSFILLFISFAPFQIKYISLHTNKTSRFAHVPNNQVAFAYAQTVASSSVHLWTGVHRSISFILSDESKIEFDQHLSLRETPMPLPLFFRFHIFGYRLQ